ncbi:MAG: glycosyltransferase family 4 protein [Lentisphaeraceae bacterium]|nr:glycosyltransferase family 4 protein [Lentisphaeraceae bacterium]
MKIAFVTEHFNPGKGGQETYMNDFTKFLISEGHEVHFYTQDKHENQDKLFFHQVSVSGLFVKLRWLQWVFFAKEAKRLADMEGVDILMGTGKCMGVNVFQPHGGTTRASQRQNALLVRSPLHTFFKIFFNTLSPKHIVAKKIETLQYSNENCQFVAISEMVKSHMNEFYKIPQEKITLVYNGIDTSKFSPATDAERLQARKDLGLPEKDVIFSTVAHNFKLKGVREIIEAAVEISKTRTDFKIVIAGNGKRKKFQALAEKLGVSEYILFLGAVNNPEKVYTASDVYVQATWYDPCSLVVLESLAAGLPTITTKFNGAGELIEDGKSGFVVSRPDSLQELSETMLKLFDPELRERIGERAREAVKDRTLENNFKQMLSVFKKIS